MDTKQISDTLLKIFQEKRKRIVFWYDAGKEFEDMLSSIHLDDVAILRLDEHGALELKIKLETDRSGSDHVKFVKFMNKLCV
jgi:hypothetical protein